MKQPLTVEQRRSVHTIVTLACEDLVRGRPGVARFFIRMVRDDLPKTYLAALRGASADGRRENPKRKKGYQAFRKLIAQP